MVFHTNIEQTRDLLSQLAPQISDYHRLTLLLKETLQVVESKPEKRPSLYRRLQKASQGPCSGINWRPKSKSYLKKLQADSPSTIGFNAEKLSWTTRGGNCTAIALEFIERYFNSDSSESAESRLKRIAKSLKFGGNIREMRARQGAFNCIEVKNSSAMTGTAEKVGALLNFHDFKLINQSNTFDLLDDLRPKLSGILSSMDWGIYFMRDIKPANNDKLEEHGHSMVLIRTRGGDFFFDPNKGLEKIEAQGLEERVFEHLKHNYKRFEISQATFFKVVRPTSPPANHSRSD